MILTINSEDGWQKLIVREIERFDIEATIYIQLRIGLYSRYWNRKEMLNNEFNNLIDDVEFDYKQHWVKMEDWSELKEKFNNWKNDGSLFLHKLEGEPDEFIQLELSNSDDKMICSVEKPILKLTIVNTRYSIEYKMIIDRSSINQEISYN